MARLASVPHECVANPSPESSGVAGNIGTVSKLSAATSDQFGRERVEQIRATLREWATGHVRRLPWRRPLPIWKALVAEVMLLRTRANQVVAAFVAFDARYLTPTEFGSASEQDLRALLAPLGLRWRVPLLLRLAKEIGRCGGQLPLDQKSLELLPGVGQYAAAATLSLHAGIPAVLIDANTVRVIARLLGKSFDGETRRKGWLRAAADELTPRDGNREFNYALLDLAASVCRPRRPRCGECPLRRWCVTGMQVETSAD